MLQGCNNNWQDLERNLAWELLAEKENAEVNIWEIINEIVSPECHISKELIHQFEDKGALQPKCSCQHDHTCCKCNYLVHRKFVALFLNGD